MGGFLACIRRDCPLIVIIMYEHPDVMLVVDGDTMCTVQYTDRAIAMVMASGRAPERPLRDVTKWQQPRAHVVTVAELLFK